MPYDRFVREQIAGDVLKPVTGASIAATGMLVAGPWDAVQRVTPSRLGRLQSREEQLEEIVATVGQTFLGVTVNCARCHDHKFDPIPTHEYYAMAGLFTSTESLYSGGGGQGNGKQKNTGFHQLIGDGNAAEARQMLKTIRGKTHTVFTGYCLLNVPAKRGAKAKVKSTAVRTRVTMGALSEAEIRKYIRSGEPMDKAGAYGIQDDYGAVFVRNINGCFYNVVGFPLAKFYITLQEFQQQLRLI